MRGSYPRIEPSAAVRESTIKTSTAPLAALRSTVAGLDHVFSTRPKSFLLRWPPGSAAFVLWFSHRFVKRLEITDEEPIDKVKATLSEPLAEGAGIGAAAVPELPPSPLQPPMAYYATS